MTISETKEAHMDPLKAVLGARVVRTDAPPMKDIPTVGDVGTVVIEVGEDNLIGVRWDGFIHGHDLDENNENVDGWFVVASHIELV